MPYFTFANDKISLYYETYGEKGPWLTLINGYSRTHKDFRSLAKKLASNNMKILVFDNRGCGKTSSEINFSLEDMCDDIFYLWQHLKISNSNVLGISMGGLIAQIFTIKYARYVNKLILISTTKNLADINKIEKRSWPKDIESIKSKMETYVNPEFAKKNQPLILFMAQEMQNQLKNLVGSSYAQKDAIKNTKQEIIKTNLITTNTLILHGKEDKIIDCDAAVIINKTINNSILKIFANTGHLLLAENFTKLYNEILFFIKKQI